MARQVTQDTFDGIVKENVQEFEMTVEEAINDTVQQLESQGVNLMMIIRDRELYTETGDRIIHPVIAALNALSSSLEGKGDNSSDEKHLETIKQDCDIDLSHRCFAGKNNAYPVLLRALKQYRTGKKDLLIKTLQTLCSLCDGQPDLLEGVGCEDLMSILRDETLDQDIIELVVKLIRLNCIKHEMNRRMFVEKDLIKELVRVLTTNKHSTVMVKEVTFGLRVLTQDDDLRVPFGSAHENAKQIVTEGDALRQLIDICKEFTANIEVQAELFSTLGKLMVRNEFCKEVMDLGGLDLIMSSFQTNIAHKDIVKQALGVLKALAGNDDIKIAIVKADGIQLILAAITQHQGNAGISSAGCQTLATLVLRQPTHCAMVINNNGHHVILQAMKIHRGDEQVQKQACMAIRNIVARTRDLCQPFLEMGAEELINAARLVPNCEDEAKAALRDLDCQVELKTPWSGERGSIPQAAH